jgi:hypothetical protein
MALQTTSSPASACSSYTLDKIEFLITANCTGAIYNATVGGRPVASSYVTSSKDGQTYITFKLTNLQGIGAAAGSAVQFSLKPTCTLQQVLYSGSADTFWYAMFDAAQTCCPTFDT